MTNFPDAEFAAASHRRRLSSAELEKAQRFRELFLDDARTALAFPVRITSFVRLLSSTHGGDSLDIQPCRTCGGVAIGEELFQRRLEALFQWIGINRPESFGVLIHERNHVHVTLPGFQGRVGHVYREPVEGEYVMASLRPLLALAPLFLIGAAVMLIILNIRSQ